MGVETLNNTLQPGDDLLTESQLRNASGLAQAMIRNMVYSSVRLQGLTGARMARRGCWD